MGKDKCYQGGNRHSFEARYHSTVPEKIKGDRITPELIEALKNKEYIGDICIWCGKTIGGDYDHKI